MPMTVITDHLIKTMDTMGAQSIRESTKKHIKKETYGPVIPDNLSKAALVKENLALSSELNSFKTEDLSSRAKLCAVEIRKIVRESSKEQEWPPNPEALNSEYINIPKCLAEFLYALLGKKVVTRPSLPKQTGW